MISPLNDGFLRGFLRVYFLISFLSINLVGSQVCKCANKLRVSRGNYIKVIEMTGLLRLPEILKGIWRLRRLPGGLWSGLLMAAVGICSVISDLATSALVTKQWLPSRCKFDQGLVVNGNKSIYASPPPNEAGSRTARDSQLNSDSNGGDIGIYYKSNTDPDFRATSEDIMGWWTCNPSMDSSIIPASDDLGTIFDKLFKADLQYSPDASGETSNIDGDGNTKQVIYISASAVEGSNAGVKGSFDQGYSFENDKVFSNYHCQLNPSSRGISGLQTILGSINMTTAMLQWVDNLPSLIYDGPDTPITSSPESYLELVLNAMMMVQGGSGSILSPAISGLDQKYGCITPQTEVSPFVIFLTVAVALTLTGLLSQWIYLLIYLGEKKSALEPFPNNLLTWMLQSTRESTFANSGDQLHRLSPSKESDLEGWVFGGQDGDGAWLRVTRKENAIPLTGMVSPGIAGTDDKTGGLSETVVEHSRYRGIFPYEGV
ncbi:hypothetical protein BDZ45DRAFT_744396 [Acephala macrosclerotiorum]|nr:hypothetical protein BDZ45DRAFT_744396 [Acephala macrosclerotiorum]